MNKIDTQLEKIKERGTIGLMTHVVIGYPTLDATEKLVVALEKGGSDYVELQIPFSDPIADGPTIMAASDTALTNGVTTKLSLEIMKKASAKVSIPLLFMCYYNTIFHYGVENFCKAASASGASGLIVPDVPPEEERFEHLEEIASGHNLYVIRVLSPASSETRIKANAILAKGFMYCISKYGVTGTAGLHPEVTTYLKRVRKIVNLPLAVGFGITGRSHIKSLEKTADIAVVGSAIIEKIKNAGKKSIVLEVERYIKELTSQ